MTENSWEKDCLEFPDFRLIRVNSGKFEGQKAKAMKEREGKLVTVCDIHNLFVSGYVENGRTYETYKLRTKTRNTFSLNYHDIIAIFDVEKK